MNMNFDFNNPTRILFGSGKLKELGSQSMPGKKALLLMSGGRSAKVSGAYDRTLEQLHKAGVEVAVFARENGCDFLYREHRQISAPRCRTDYDFRRICPLHY